MATQGQRGAAYDDLLEQYEPIVNLSSAREVLNWDQQVMMPEGGTPARSKQLSTLSRLHHDLLTDDRIGSLLDTLENEELDAEAAAVVREIRREHDRAAKVPRDLVEEISEASAEAHPVWREARQADDFSQFEPHLERIVELRREYAAEIDPDEDPYTVLFADYEPYLSIEKADEVLTSIRDTLVPLIDAVEDADPIVTDAFDGTFPVDEQEAMTEEVLDLLGYNWERGRLDTAPHPFSMGTQFDARVTTRFDEADVLSALTSTIHEFGHAHYQLGLPDDAYGSPLGQYRDLTVHESQSRFWENHVGRSRAFWELYLPKLADRFQEQLSDVTVEAAYQSANQVYPDNPIRVEADELTYHLHIVVRYEIERALVEGELDVEDVPATWNDKYEEYLGFRPDTDADGCLQDIHWSNGAIGYFPTYSLGSVMAAQVADAIERDVGEIDTKARNGEFEPITEWLRSEIHQHGQRYTTPDLVERATGAPYSAEAFNEYVTEKYSRLYGL